MRTRKRASETEIARRVLEYPVRMAALKNFWTQFKDSKPLPETSFFQAFKNLKTAAEKSFLAGDRIFAIKYVRLEAKKRKIPTQEFEKLISREPWIMFAFV